MQERAKEMYWLSSCGVGAFAMALEELLQGDEGGNVALGEFGLDGGADGVVVGGRPIGFVTGRVDGGHDGEQSWGWRRAGRYRRELASAGSAASRRTVSAGRSNWLGLRIVPVYPNIR